MRENHLYRKSYDAIAVLPPGVGIGDCTGLDCRERETALKKLSPFSFS